MNKFIIIFGFSLLIACLSGTQIYYGDLNEPGTYAVPGLGGEYVYSIGFSDAGASNAGPIERSEGRGGSIFHLGFHEKDFREDVRLELTNLSPIRFTHLETGKTYTTINKINNSEYRVFTSSFPDLPLGHYRIEFSGRFCANTICKTFSQVLENELIRKGRFFSAL